MSSTGAIIVGTVELVKLANILIQASLQAAALAKMSEAEIDASYQKAKTEYLALPPPGDIPEPK